MLCPLPVTGYVPTRSGTHETRWAFIMSSLRPGVIIGAVFHRMHAWSPRLKTTIDNGSQFHSAAFNIRASIRIFGWTALEASSPKWLFGDEPDTGILTLWDTAYMHCMGPRRTSFDASLIRYQGHSYQGYVIWELGALICQTSQGYT
jgi:hypothetical protein